MMKSDFLVVIKFDMLMLYVVVEVTGFLGLNCTRWITFLIMTIYT